MDDPYVEEENNGGNGNNGNEEEYVNEEEEEEDEVNEEEVEEEEENAGEENTGSNPVNQSIQIAASSDDDLDPQELIELGDYVVVQCKKYGQIVGTVYFRSLELIRIKPVGVSNRLYDFPIDDEEFDEEDGVTDVFIVDKHTMDAFVAQQDFRVGQIIDTYDSAGEIFKSYQLTAVNREEDTITFHEEDDPETVQTVEFDGIGIPMDLPFVAITIRVFSTEMPSGEEAANENGAAINQNRPLEDVAVVAEPVKRRIQVVGMVEITRPVVLKEAESHEQRIPETLQKTDAFNDFINELDARMQKDPDVIRSIRILVETLHRLKHDSIEYYSDGSVKGPKEVSAHMISTLLEKVPVPLSRPILSATKRLYDLSEFKEEKGDEKGEEKEERNPYLSTAAPATASASAAESSGSGRIGGSWWYKDADEDHLRMTNFLDELAVMKQLDRRIAIRDDIVPYWSYLRALIKEFARPWDPIQHSTPYWSAMDDTEFFREAPPETTSGDEDHPRVLQPTVKGYVASGSDKRPPLLDEVPFGLERALGATRYKGADRQTQVLLEADRASMLSCLVFPLRAAPYLGRKRTSFLAMDSGRSQMRLKSMADLLIEMGSPKELGATSHDVVILGVQGGTLGNIPLTDYLEGMTLPALSLSDTYPLLDHYGLLDLEWNEPILHVLQDKITRYQAQWMNTMATLRETAQSIAPQNEPITDLLLAPNGPSFMDTLRSQPILRDALDEYVRCNPRLATHDLGQIAYLSKTMENFIQVTAGKQPYLISKAIVEETNLRFLHDLRIASLVKYNQEHSAKPPRRNRCEHVADLVSVRRIKNDTERYQEFKRVFERYQGVRTGNWIDCNTCKEHFVCIHERLQMHAFRHRNQKDVIEKEIMLQCAGGVFQGAYICRNCGQPIRDLDFDNHMEFTDDGRPKSGTAVLEDEDKDFEDALDELSMAPSGLPETKQMGLTEAQEQCYHLVKELAIRVGIQLDRPSYHAIIDRVMNHMSKFPTQAQYIKEQLTRARETKKRGPDYQVARARIYMCSVAASLLLDIQMKIPNYTIRYTMIGSRSPGFGGYPLKTTESDMQGITYVAFAVTMLDSSNPIWTDTRFGGQDRAKNPEQIHAGVQGIIYSLVNEFMTGDPSISMGLAQKRSYETNVLGSESSGYGQRVRDHLPASFLPEPILITPEETAQKEDVIMPEIAKSMGMSGRMALVKLWIRQSHRIAKETVTIVRGSPYSELTCCIAPVQQPSSFWTSHTELPMIGSRRLRPTLQGGALVTEFVPRPANEVVAAPDQSLYHRIFLKCCYDGPWVGHPHEPGLTNKCIRCGFQFPSHPKVMNSDEEGKAALASQEVAVDTQSFTELLDTIHRVNEVTPEEERRIMTLREIMGAYGAVEPPPMPSWNGLMAQSMERLMTLPPDATKEDTALAIQDLAQQASQMEDILRERMPLQTYLSHLTRITELPWTSFFQVLQTHFIAPFQRLLTGFPKETLFVPAELEKDLAPEHLRVLHIILSRELGIVLERGEDMKRPEYEMARAKMAYAVKQWSVLLQFKDRIRERMIPGRGFTLEYFKRAMLYGPLGTMIDPNQLPPHAQFAVEPSSDPIGHSSTLFLLHTVKAVLDKFHRERLSYNEQELRQEIAVREEKERVSFIKKFDRLSEDLKRIELQKKRLGLGDWAVGGTSVIYKYDKDYYGDESRKRSEAGIVDFPELMGHRLAREDGFDAIGLASGSRQQEGYEIDMHGDNRD